MGTIASSGAFLADAGGDWIFGAVDFLDFPELGAYLVANRSALYQGTAETFWDARAWRRRNLEARLPSYIHYNEFHASCASSQTPAQLRNLCHLGGFRDGACTFRLARGLHFYEQKQFEAAAEELRTLLKFLPGCTKAMCHLADTLYGRAVSLHTAVFSTPPPLQRQEASSQLVRTRGTAYVANTSLNSRSPNGASIAERQTVSSAVDTSGHTPSSRSSSESGTAGEAPDDEAVETSTANHGNEIRGGEVPNREPDLDNRPADVDESGEVANDEDANSASEERIAQLEATREKLLSEAKRLYEEAHQLEPCCSLAVNGLALFIKTKPEKLKQLELAVKLDDENSYALANLGGELLGVDDHKALVLLDKALEINPHLFYARLVKSKVMLRLGDLPGAVEAARSQLEWQPNDEMAARFLSQLEFRLEIVRRRMLLR